MNPVQPNFSVKFDFIFHQTFHSFPKQKLISIHRIHWIEIGLSALGITCTKFPKFLDKFQFSCLFNAQNQPYFVWFRTWPLHFGQALLLPLLQILGIISSPNSSLPAETGIILSFSGFPVMFPPVFHSSLSFLGIVTSSFPIVSSDRAELRGNVFVFHKTDVWRHGGPGDNAPWTNRCGGWRPGLRFSLENCSRLIFGSFTLFFLY